MDLHAVVVVGGVGQTGVEEEGCGVPGLLVLSLKLTLESAGNSSKLPIRLGYWPAEHQIRYHGLRLCACACGYGCETEMERERGGKCVCVCARARVYAYTGGAGKTGGGGSTKKGKKEPGQCCRWRRGRGSLTDILKRQLPSAFTR